MNCEHLEQLLLRGETLNPEAREHLKACRQCQDYQRLLEAVGGGFLDGPSAALDRRVLDMAHADMAASQRRRLFRRMLAGIAAAVTVLLALALWIQTPAEKTLELASASKNVQTLVTQDDAESLEQDYEELDEALAGLELDVTEFPDALEALELVTATSSDKPAQWMSTGEAVEFDQLNDAILELEQDLEGH